MRLIGLAFFVVIGTACLDPQDNPTTVKDLRVLGIAFEPPEIMARSCDVRSLPLIALTLPPVEARLLVIDPQGRPIAYELSACANQGDVTCTNPGERVDLACSRSLRSPGCGEDLISGETRLPPIQLATAATDKGFLLPLVQAQAPYAGIGGLRVPVVLHVRVPRGEELPDEEVFAQKLMVYNCPWVPGMTTNVTPKVPGLMLQGEPWLEGGELRELEGAGPFKIEPEKFTDLEEEYVVPSLAASPAEMKPIKLVESWKLAWHADYGTFSQAETGGVVFGSESGIHKVEWRPPNAARELTEPKVVSFYVVVRDGRGGESWLLRQARYRPTPP
jgi:hypothetical protein